MLPRSQLRYREHLDTDAMSGPPHLHFSVRKSIKMLLTFISATMRPLFVFLLLVLLPPFLSWAAFGKASKLAKPSAFERSPYKTQRSLAFPSLIPPAPHFFLHDFHTVSLPHLLHPQVSIAMQSSVNIFLGDFQQILHGLVSTHAKLAA